LFVSESSFVFVEKTAGVPLAPASSAIGLTSMGPRRIPQVPDVAVHLPAALQIFLRDMRKPW
jgi:hypothetical protein